MFDAGILLERSQRCVSTDRRGLGPVEQLATRRHGEARTELLDDSVASELHVVRQLLLVLAELHWERRSCWTRAKRSAHSLRSASSRIRIASHSGRISTFFGPFFSRSI